MLSDELTNSEFFLSVGDGHKLYVQDWGKQDAQMPIIFLHGGPGGGCDDSHKSYFDGQRQRVIFFDQRGAGQSTPKGSLENNTTQDLVSDILKLLQELNLEKVIIFGRSWGSCLALNFAVRYPEYVQSLVLGGIFLGSKAELKYCDNGDFRIYYPEVWQYLIDQTPPQYQDDPTAYHSARIQGKDQKAAVESGMIINTVVGATIKLDDRLRPIDPETYDLDPIKIERYYIDNNCFIPDNYIIKNASKLTMPVWIVQGRYDMICPPEAAWQLAKALPDAHYISTIAGHSGNDRANLDTLQSITAALTLD